MDAQKELAGLIKEIQQGNTENKDAIEKMSADLAAQKEENIKIVESNTELKAQLEALQGKIAKYRNKAGGESSMIFKGFDPQTSKNWKACIPREAANEYAKYVIEVLKGPVGTQKAFAGDNALREGFGNLILGLSELNSVCLQYMNVVVQDTKVKKYPTKATRATSTMVATGTTAAATTPTLGQITFTLDKYLGAYINVPRDDIEDSDINFVSTFLLPLLGESVGQYVDDEVFNGTNSEFTSTIIEATASVTADGSTPSISLANLNTMYNALSWDRGITNPMWFGPQGVFKDVMGLVGTANDHPILLNNGLSSVPPKNIFGAPYVVTSVIANAPADGAMRLCFGDPKHYMLAIRGPIENLSDMFTRMLYHEITLLASMRVDGNIADHATPASSGAWTVMSRVDS